MGDRVVMHGDEPGPGRIRLAPGVEVPEGVLTFSFSSSSGPGGQNVNKRATKAELRVRLEDLGIGAGVQSRLAALAGHRMTSAGELVIDADEHRSQLQNKAACLDRLGELILLALVEPKRRKKTRPSAGSKQRRLREKKIRGEHKRNRRSGSDE
jgi:ribosome-associated protein